MKPYFETGNCRLYQGHVLEILENIQSESIHCVITSPPYWGLRDYGLEPRIWDAVSNCEHEWGDKKTISTGRHDKCGAPWERVIEKKSSTMNIRVRDVKKGRIKHTDRKAKEWEIKNYGKEELGYCKTLDWQPTCKCNQNKLVPCTVLDPFFGAGTTGSVAEKYNRKCIGIELNSEYCEITAKRLEKETQQMKLFR